MAITAEIVGGPLDGKVVTFNGIALRVPIYNGPPPWEITSERIYSTYVEMTPVLTPNGYRLYWPKD